MEVGRSVCAGGDIRDSHINININEASPEKFQGLLAAATKPLKEVTAEQQRTIAELQRYYAELSMIATPTPPTCWRLGSTRGSSNST